MLLATLALLLQQPVAQPAPRPDSVAVQAPGRRRAVTTQLLGTAYADDGARQLLLRAREARLRQDQALRGYDARTQSRVSVALGVGRLARNRLLFRTENVSNVRWRRGQGMLVEPLGARTTVPMAKNIGVNGIAESFIPVPYFPGRDQLWLPGSEGGGVVRRTVDEEEGFIHPIAAGSEAYYRYASGDSIRFRLPTGEVLTLRELKVTARRPEFRSFVGSFWFDEKSALLVRAAYRMAAPLEIWSVAMEESIRELEEARRDTSANRAARIKEVEEDMPPAWVRGMMNPLRAELSLVTVEYALYEGKYWLPRVNRAEGQVQAMFMKLPVTVQESYRYDDVDGATPLPVLPDSAVRRRQGGSIALCGGGSGCTPSQDEDDFEAIARLSPFGLRDSLLQSVGQRMPTPEDTSAAAELLRRRADSLMRVTYAVRDRGGRRLYRMRIDSLLAARNLPRPGLDDSSRVASRQRSVGDSILRAEFKRQRREARDAECKATGGFYSRMQERSGGALRYALRLPCDSTVLANSKELPPSPYDSGEEVFAMRDAEQLANALGLSLQPVWAPQRPVVGWPLRLQRYNRVEGLSLGAEATMQLGKGYTASALARVGLADRQPNGELRLSRSNGRATLHAAAFRRLNASNDFGDPLSLGASMTALLYGRDEGFYYRGWGAEVGWTQERASGQWSWRLFGERHDPARRRTNFALSTAFNDDTLLANINAQRGQIGGVQAGWVRSFGLNPDSWRTTIDLRAEGGAGSFAYGRGLTNISVARPLFGRFDITVTGSAGAATDSVPVQRQFVVGGLRTVRGQVAGTNIGPTYWFTRSELGLARRSAIKPTLFYDMGWAGRREDFTTPGRPMSGAGVGLSLLDGLIRLDLARGIHPRKLTRFDMSLEARF